MIVSSVTGYDTRSPQQMKLLTTHYNKAVSRIIPYMSVDSVENIHCALEMFSHLSIEATTFMDDTILPDRRQRWAMAGAKSNNNLSLGPFQDLEEAAYGLHELCVRNADITRADLYGVSKVDSLQTSEAVNGEDWHDYGDADALFEEVQRGFRQWIACFELTKTVLEHRKNPLAVSQQLLSVTLAQRFWSMHLYFAPEPCLDPTADFLDAAEALMKTLPTPSHFTFSLDGDLISGLSFVVRVCSDTNSRRRALNLLRSLNRREGIWDSKEITEMHEATLSFDDYETWYEKEAPGGIPAYMVDLARI
ncbi:hypothetical protein B0T10DRAFT_417471 [Thelonectria olida]|uniref:Uncharacterized protein n=1 Tax=Thelonectria olida TaxID=1576542 RepID=A0A9P9AIS1_9HYPO|nr:hypothetical protein B0T10DRAFT_417471 [Thelonectria olida]